MLGTRLGLAAALGVLVVVLSLSAYTMILRSEIRALEAEKDALRAESLAFDATCQANISRLEAVITSYNTATREREKALRDRDNALGKLRTDDATDQEAFDAETHRIMSEVPQVPNGAHGVARELAVCRSAMQRLRR